MIRCAASVANILAIATSVLARARFVSFCPRGARDEQPRGVELGRHVGQRRLHELLLGERLAELHARRHVRDGLVERAPRHAHGRGADRGAEDVERAEREAQPVPDLAERARRRDAAPSMTRRPSG